MFSFLFAITAKQRKEEAEEVDCCVCVFSFKVAEQIDCVHFFLSSPEKPLTLSANNVQDEIQTNFSFFVFPPNLFFKQMLWIFLCYYTSSAERNKKKMNFFPPTELGNIESVFKPRNTCFCSTKKKKRREQEIKRTTSGQLVNLGMDVRSQQGWFFCCFFLQKDSSAE